MDYTEFYAKLIDLGINIDTAFGEEKEWVYQADHSHPKQKVVKKGIDAIVQQDIIGESTGGNCFNDNPSVYESVKIEGQLSFNDLDTILTKLCPTISYLQYKELYNSIVKEDEETQSEYYGNYTDYHVFIVGVEDLYKYLKGLDLI